MRRLYWLILRAHPRAFRERFEAEMLCVFDDAVRTEGSFCLTVDCMLSLLRQRVFRLQAASNTAQNPADGPDILGSFSIAHQLSPLKISRVILGGAISFNLFIIACTLIGGGRAHSVQHQQIYATGNRAAHALSPSDLVGVSDECAAAITMGCLSQPSDTADIREKVIRGSQSRPDELPFPSGRFGIGQVSYSAVTSEIPPSGVANPEFKLLVWYPAAVNFDTSVPVDNVWGFSKSTGKFVQTHTVLNAAPAHGDSRFPLILFSPAGGNESAAYFSQIENLVSHGYIVASLENPETLNVISFQEPRLAVFEADMRRAFIYSVNKNMEAVLARAASLSQTREKAESAKLRYAFNQMILIATDRSQRAPFAGRVDFEHVGAFGHGSGGNAVTQFCASDVRISACVDEDGWAPDGLLAEANPPQLPRQALLRIDMPLKWPDEAELTYAHLPRDRFTRLIEASAMTADSQLRSLTGGAYHISLLAPDLNDKNFTDGPLVWSMKDGRVGDQGARTALAAINLYSTTFFDKYLKGRSAPLLDSNTDSPFSNVRIKRYSAQ
jgi:hypothetical protein